MGEWRDFVLGDAWEGLMTLVEAGGAGLRHAGERFWTCLRAGRAALISRGLRVLLRCAACYVISAVLLSVSSQLFCTGS